MVQESRVKKTLLNARVNLIFYFLTLALSFFSRKIFLDCLGADFIGLTGTLYNLLGYLNLAELGIGSAIGYLLYKPLFDHDQQIINEIISVMGYLYRWIGLIILAGGCILACFLPLIYPDSGFDLPLIYFAYFSFLASSLIGYFINYRQNLLGADQRNYVVTAYFQTANIVKTLIQMSLAYYTGSYYLWVAIELSFGIIYSVILNWKINQTYPWLKADVRQGRLFFKKYPEVMRYTRQLFIHKINGMVQFQTTPILTYAFDSLQMVAYYGNYTIVLDKLVLLIGQVLGSTGASIGNLIAEGDSEKTEKVFWELTFLRSWIGGVFAFCSFLLIDSFIEIWLGNQYLLPKIIVLLVSLKIYIQFSLDYIGPFLYGFGLFADVWASVLQSILFIIFALIGGYFWGIAGIISAAILSISLVVGIWKPFYLYHFGFHKSVLYYWKKYIGLNLINLASCILSYLLYVFSPKSPVTSLFSFAVQALLLVTIYFTVSSIISIILIKESRTLINKLKHQIRLK